MRNILFLHRKRKEAGQARHRSRVFRTIGWAEQPSCCGSSKKSKTESGSGLGSWGNSRRHRLWPCSASFAEISAGLIVVRGSHTASKLPLCRSRFFCRKPNAVKSSATSYGGQCPSRGILIWKKEIRRKFPTHFSSGSWNGLSFEFHRVTQGLVVGREAVAITPCLAASLTEDFLNLARLVSSVGDKLPLCCTFCLTFSIPRLPPICSKPEQTLWSWESRRLGARVLTNTSDSTEETPHQTCTHIIIHSFFQVF